MKKLFFILTILFISQHLFSLEIDKSELQSSTENSAVEFISYEGPHKTIDSAASIQGIGTALGKQVSQNMLNPFSTDKSEKYYVIHAVDENETSKLDADILFLNKNAGVDHIKNLRRIISGYISSAYGYSQSDSDTLSVFVTVYNAVYRGKKEYFSEKYKGIVLENLSEKKCGLSTNYKEWPGNSEIIIPLSDVKNAGLSIIDTSVISDSKVINSMQDDDGKNIESRKEMVNIKERESDQAYEKAQSAQKNVVEQQKQLAEEEEKTKELEKEAKEAEYKAEQNPDDEELKENAEKKAEELEEQKQKEEELKQSIQESKEEASKQQAISDKKESEAQAERKQISKDQSQVQKEEAAKSKIKAGFGVMLSDNDNLLSQVVKFNIENGEIIQESPVKVIRNRTVYKTTDKYLAIAGETAANEENRDIRLVLLDGNSLELFNQSTESVSENSVLVQDNENYYCIIFVDDKWVIGKYDENLNLLAKSETEVFPATPLTINEDLLAVTDKDGKFILLDKNELKTVLLK